MPKAAFVIFFLIPAIFADTYTNQQAVAILTSAGIGIYSSGGCSDKSNPKCTSLDGIHSECIDGANGIITFKQVSGCSITITGGTEVGHASGMWIVYLSNRGHRGQPPRALLPLPPCKRSYALLIPSHELANTWLSTPSYRSWPCQTKVMGPKFCM